MKLRHLGATALCASASFLGCSGTMESSDTELGGEETETAEQTLVTGTIYRVRSSDGWHREVGSTSDPGGNGIVEATYGVNTAGGSAIYRCALRVRTRFCVDNICGYIWNVLDDFPTTGSTCEGATASGYTNLGVIGYSVAGASPVYRCVVTSGAHPGEHFISRSSSCEGQRVEGVVFYAR